MEGLVPHLRVQKLTKQRMFSELHISPRSSLASVNEVTSCLERPASQCGGEQRHHTPKVPSFNSLGGGGRNIEPSFTKACYFATDI